MTNEGRKNVLKARYIWASTASFYTQIGIRQRIPTMVAANDEVIPLFTRQCGHSNSVTAVSHEDSIVVNRQICDAFSIRIASTKAANDPHFATDRGYTGHQMLDGNGLIHMNGRLYAAQQIPLRDDPFIGRFLSPDPLIEEVGNLQSFAAQQIPLWDNRYSYVMNNPMSVSDPTGYASFWATYRRPIIAIGVAWAMGPAGIFGEGGITGSNFYSTVAAGAASGGIQGGNVQSAVFGAFMATLSYGVGDWSGNHAATAKNVAMSPEEIAKQVAGHAVIGCVSGAASGGSCAKSGFAAGMATAIGPRLLGSSDGLAQFVSSAIVGGVASRIVGGSFESGAVSGAFGYLFNHLTADARAKPFLDKLRGSKIAAERLAAIEKSDMNVSVEFDDGYKGGMGDPAGTVAPPNKSTIKIIINPLTIGKWQYGDNKGGFHDLTIERTLAHELTGHAYDIVSGGSKFAGQKIRQDYVISIENRIMRELYPTSVNRVENHGCCYRVKPQ